MPVQPLLEGSSRPYVMFKDYWKYEWVLPVYRYEGIEPLLARLAEKVIAPAEGEGESPARATAHHRGGTDQASRGIKRVLSDGCYLAMAEGALQRPSRRRSGGSTRAFLGQTPHDAWKATGVPTGRF